MDDQAGESGYGADGGASGGAGGTVRLPHDVVAARLQREAEALADLRARQTLPDNHGAVGYAPARGPLRLDRDWTVQRGGTRVQTGAHWVRADVFDVMDLAARKAHARHGEGAAYQPGFSWVQIDTARRYAVLSERHGAGGMRCASLEAGRGGSGGGSFIDAYLAEGVALARLHVAIGAGVALSVRRVRPSARGGAGAGLIHDRVLVDAVCLAGLTLSKVLVRHGWSNYGVHVAGLRGALCAALDRMQGVGAAFCTK